MHQGWLRAADREGSAAGLRGDAGRSRSRPRPRSSGPRLLGRRPGLVSERHRAPYSGHRKPEGALRAPSSRRRLPVRGSRVPPSGPPQVSEEAQRLLGSLPLPSPVGVATWPSRALPSLRLVPSRTASYSRAPYKTSRPRSERNDHSQLHNIFHHSRHLPCFSQAGKPRVRSAQALGPLGNQFPRPSAQALPGRARPRTSVGQQVAGCLPRAGSRGSPTRRRDRDRRAPRGSGLSPASSTWRPGGKDELARPEIRRREVGKAGRPRGGLDGVRHPATSLTFNLLVNPLPALTVHLCPQLCALFRERIIMPQNWAVLWPAYWGLAKVILPSCYQTQPANSQVPTFSPLAS